MTITYGQGGIPIGPRPPKDERARGIFFTAAGLLILIAIGWKLNHERQAHGTVLGVPVYRWGTRELASHKIVSPAGDYSFSVRQARLEWRRPYGFLGKGGAALRLAGFPGLTLAVREEEAEAARLDDEQILVTVLRLGETRELVDVIEVPGALKGKFFVTAQGPGSGGAWLVQGAFKSPGKVVVMSFAPRGSGGASALSDDAAHDIRLIAGSFAFGP